MKNDSIDSSITVKREDKKSEEEIRKARKKAGRREEGREETNEGFELQNEARTMPTSTNIQHQQHIGESHGGRIGGRPTEGLADLGGGRQNVAKSMKNENSFRSVAKCKARFRVK